MKGPSVLTTTQHGPFWLHALSGWPANSCCAARPAVLKDPPFQHLLVGSLSGRLLAASDHLMVPSQLERWEQWVRRRDGKGTGGLCLVVKLNAVGRAEVM